MFLHEVAAPIAEGQLGLVTRRQLIARGVPGPTVESAVRRRHLLPTTRGVYRLPGAPATTEVRLLAMVLAVGDGAVLSHRPVRGPLEIDIAWPDLRVAFELEGADHRDRSIVHDDDTERQNWLQIAGWRVVRTTYRRWLRHTSTVLAELEAALALAASRVPGT